MKQKNINVIFLLLIIGILTIGIIIYFFKVNKKVLPDEVVDIHTTINNTNDNLNDEVYLLADMSHCNGGMIDFRNVETWLDSKYHIYSNRTVEIIYTYGNNNIKKYKTRLSDSDFKELIKILENNLDNEFYGAGPDQDWWDIKYYSKNKEIINSFQDIAIKNLVFKKIVNLLNNSIKYYNSSTEYYAPLLISGKEYGAIFDNSYKVYFDDSYEPDYLVHSTNWKVFIEYDEKLHNYIINAKFDKKDDYISSHSTLVIEDADGNQITFDVSIWLGIQDPDGGEGNIVQIRKNSTNKKFNGWRVIYSEFIDGVECITELAEFK